MLHSFFCKDFEYSIPIRFIPNHTTCFNNVLKHFHVNTLKICIKLLQFLALKCKKLSIVTLVLIHVNVVAPNKFNVKHLT